MPSSATRKLSALPANGTQPARVPARTHPPPVTGPHRTPFDTPACARPSLASRSHNLPRPATSFIGRARELAEIRELLARRAPGRADRARLLTLTGPSGSGKTRLAMELACSLVEAFNGGVWWVELAPLTDPGMVAQAVARVLGVREEGGRALGETLLETVGSKQMLLVLDNCEHLAAACADLARELLPACPGLCLLATSQVALSVAGEVVWPVPPLALPARQDLAPDRSNGVEGLLAYDAVHLFVERARAAYPGFALTSDNEAAVLTICRRLDGIPLAIELAAARVKMLAPQQIADRLDHALQLLTRGAGSSLPRHQTLRAAVDWSYDLLANPEKVLLRRLAVFAGSFNLAAAEAVCAEDGVDREDVLDLLWDLLEKSLVIAAPAGPHEARYRLLETIRQYATEKLLEAGELERLRDAHLDFFVRLAEELAPRLLSAELAALDRLEADHDNLREALAWGLHPGEPQWGRGQRLAVALTDFWYLRGFFGEGRAWLEKAAAGDAPVISRPRAQAASGAGTLAWCQGDYGQATRWHLASLALYRELGERQGSAFALNALGAQATLLGRYEEARERFDEALAIFRELGDKRGSARVLHNQAHIAMAGGDLSAAEAIYQEGLLIWRNLGDRMHIAMALNALAELAIAGGQFNRAAGLLQESAELCRTSGMRQMLSSALESLGRVARCQGDLSRAIALHLEGLALAQELGDKHILAENLEGLALVAAAQSQDEAAARLFGAAERLRGVTGDVLLPHAQETHAQAVAELGARLGEAALAREWTAGAALSVEGACALAGQLAPPEAAPGVPGAASSGPPYVPSQKLGGLTAREREIARLVAQGKSNRELAGELFVGIKTIEAHISRILSKLGFTSRAQISAWAVAKGLAEAPQDLDTLLQG